MAERRAALFLIVEELFATGNPQFLPALRAFHDATPFAAFAERWLSDSRPWAREQLLAYIDLPMNAANHNSLVKRLFKGAEARRDDEILGAFAVAFDRLVRRVKRKRWRWNRTLRTSEEEAYLRTPSNTLHPDRYVTNPRTGEQIAVRGSYSAHAILFSYHTRFYLRRRAWRYFRRMGFQRPAAYDLAVSAFLARYDDRDLATGENLLDSWSLLHACFFDSDSLTFLTHRAVLKAGASVGSLEPAPMFPHLWQQPSAARPLLELISRAGARMVRVWAAGLLRRSHLASLRGLSLSEIAPLLLNEDQEVAALGVELLESASDLAAASFEKWLGLLQAKDLSVLEAVAAAMRQHFDAAKLTLFDAVTLANVAAAPTARLGLHFLRSRTISTPQERQALTNLADARAAAVGQEIAGWALAILGAADAYDVNQVTRFFDSLLAEVRQGAWSWLTPASAGWDDPALWARLMETPHDDLRFNLVDVLEKRSGVAADERPHGGAVGDVKTTGADAPRSSSRSSALSRMDPAALTPLWTSVLLNIHRGGRKKRTALRQISDAVTQHPESAERLLPVLAVAIRSVRAPEARAGLSAVVSAMTTRPELGQLVGQQLPELQVVEEAAVI